MTSTQQTSGKMHFLTLGFLVVVQECTNLLIVSIIYFGDLVAGVALAQVLLVLCILKVRCDSTCDVNFSTGL